MTDLETTETTETTETKETIADTRGQQLFLTPILLAFVAGIFGALMVDAVKSRFFPPQSNGYYIQIKEFMGEKVKAYGSLKFTDEKEQLLIADKFSAAVEASLDEMMDAYGEPIFSSPALIVGGIDLTVELDARVNDKMRKHIDGKERNEFAK